MLGEIGQFCLIAGLLLALCQGLVPLWGAQRGDSALMATAGPLSWGLFLFVAGAFGLLSAAFVLNDFSLLYVARQSNSLLPLGYRLSAVWGGHEGSLLLWVLILTVWGVAVTTFSAELPPRFRARVLAVLGLVTCGFLLFTLFTSNPFDRLLPAAADGSDLNPLLQDPGLIIHPPILYTGYVGFAVAFAFAIAALLEGRVDRHWVRWSRPWTLAAWGFLTAGIALGSWWAYYELGWGGWWFWDPVENASFMPWLAGTALIHSQAVTEKRGAFINWTLLLAILAFSLSLLGTFLVRSGVLTSVHAFAADPTRGVFILAFLGVVVGGALTLYAWRAPRLASGESFGWLSRETLLLLNNVFFASALAMVLLGTLYPLLADALNLGKISVGPPYFGLLFTLLMAPIVLLVPLGPFSRWKKDDWPRLRQALLPVLVTSLGLGLLALWLLGGNGLRAVFGWIGACWLMLGSVWYLIKSWRARHRRPPAAELGMILAHFGIGVFLVGVSVVETASEQHDLRLAPGEQISVAGYDFQFNGVSPAQGPNYSAQRGAIEVSRDGQVIALMEPEKRRYLASGSVMTEAAINPGLTRDLYVALGEPLDNSGAWSLRIYVKPYVRWIWLGALLMLIGAFLAAADRRYRQLLAARTESAPQPQHNPSLITGARA
ncbi:MAG: heme lyase CcmF/NrfE family subunit [Wenzhouxiangellaceae bacterium]